MTVKVSRALTAQVHSHDYVGYIAERGGHHVSGNKVELGHLNHLKGFTVCMTN